MKEDNFGLKYFERDWNYLV